jgi:hypothetical protein
MFTRLLCMLFLESPGTCLPQNEDGWMPSTDGLAYMCTLDKLLWCLVTLYLGRVL